MSNPEINGWTPQSERLLKNWGQMVSINESEYRKRGSRAKYCYTCWGTALIILQVGTLVIFLSTVISIIARQGVEVNDYVLFTLTGLSQFITPIFQGLTSFFNFGSVAERHFQAAKDHTAMRRLIDTILSLPRSERDNAREVLLSLRQQFNLLQDHSPSLPVSSSIRELENKIYDNPRQAIIQQQLGGIQVVIDLPSDSANTEPVETVDMSDEYISVKGRCKVSEQLAAERTILDRNSAAYKLLEYQHRRMEEHAEEIS
jgi:hypothetical protein